MTVVIRALESPDELAACAGLFADIWGEQTPHLGPPLLRAFAHTGSYVFGAYLEGALVGALVGFLALHEGRLSLHSHILGVLPEHQDRSLGQALKQHQRAWARERGMAHVTWTFDPLMARNAYFNLARLGAGVAAYLPSFYGELDDTVNQGDLTDRLLVAWDLDRPQGPVPAGTEKAPAILDIAGGAEPRPAAADAPLVLCRIPSDIVELRGRDPELALRWRLAVREALGGAIASGHLVAGFLREGAYVLSRP